MVSTKMKNVLGKIEILNELLEKTRDLSNIHGEGQVDLSPLDSLMQMFKIIYLVADSADTKKLLRQDSLKGFREELIPPFVAEHLELTKSRDSDEIMSELLVRVHEGKLSRRHWKDLRKSVQALGELFTLKHLPAMSSSAVEAFLKDRVLNSRRPKLVAAPSKELEKLKTLYHVPKRQKIEQRVDSRELFLMPESAARKTSNAQI